MKKYVFKPYILGNNTVGVEINFNKEFYVPEKLEKVEDILGEIKVLDTENKIVELWEWELKMLSHLEMKRQN